MDHVFATPLMRIHNVFFPIVSYGSPYQKALLRSSDTPTTVPALS